MLTLNSGKEQAEAQVKRGLEERRENPQSNTKETPAFRALIK